MTRFRLCCTRRCWFGVVALSLCGLSSAADPPRIAVLYPQLRPPYRAVFAEILTGIADGLAGSPLTYPTAAGAHDAVRADSSLRRWLQQQRPHAVITLGRQATGRFAAAGSRLPQVVGALDLSPQTHPAVTGVSLAVEPALVLATLRQLAPPIRRVWVIFDPTRDRWLVDRARTAAAAAGLVLTALEATGLRASAKHVYRLLQHADPQHDALWLPLGSHLIGDDSLLPVIIEQSWRRRLVTFSSSLAHVDRGVLFALYPDNAALGRRLAALALATLADPARAPAIEPLRQVKRALNLRVASHLDLPVDGATRRGFDLLLPAR